MFLSRTRLKRFQRKISQHIMEMCRQNKCCSLFDSGWRISVSAAASLWIILASENTTLSQGMSLKRHTLHTQWSQFLSRNDTNSFLLSCGLPSLPTFSPSPFLMCSPTPSPLHHLFAQEARVSAALFILIIAPRRELEMWTSGVSS